jgi:glucoamylase
VTGFGVAGLGAVSALARQMPDCESALLSEAWIHGHADLARRQLRAHVRGGAVRAAEGDPRGEYNQFHWVRDASLTMQVVVNEALRAAAGSTERMQAESILRDFIRFSYRNQQTPSQAAGGAPLLGEPKFFLDGRPFDEPWGRPQNDGPALRALTLIRYARALLARGQAEFVRHWLYRAELPGRTVIKRDLEYVAEHWREPSFDLWEEELGTHFFTRLVQHHSLTEGAELAELMGDPGAARWYRGQAAALAADLPTFWDEENGYFRSVRDHAGGFVAKRFPLDASVILAVMYGYSTGSGQDPWLRLSDDRVVATIRKLETTFGEAYPINRRFPRAKALGRYPEDIYHGGNPWVLLTFAGAEYHFRLAVELMRQGDLEITPRSLPFYRDLWAGSEIDGPSDIVAGMRLGWGDPAFLHVVSELVRKGDEYLGIVRSVMDPEGRVAEQFAHGRDPNVPGGDAVGANGLTWNAASELTAMVARDAARAMLTEPGITGTIVRRAASRAP